MFIKLQPEKDLAQVVIVDITKQIRNQEELEAMVKERTLELTESLDREKELSEMKSSFVTIASHEFRTPLSTILSSAALIKQYKETEQNDNRLKHINRISTNVNNLTGILDDFLSLEQLNSGKIDAPSVRFDLQAFLGNLVEEMEEMVNKKDQHITYNYTGATDVEQPQKIIRNIVLNLISNASKYSGTGKEIALDAGIHKGNVSISIRDQGIGIPQEDQKKLFAEFFRATNVENIQGTGLGLTIVKKYVALIGGGISFISKENEGTTFTVSFPQNKK
jgi:signal transduction histidine kinase